jgi:hypothetical protein
LDIEFAFGIEAWRLRSILRIKGENMKWVIPFLPYVLWAAAVILIRWRFGLFEAGVVSPSGALPS